VIARSGGVWSGRGDLPESLDHYSNCIEREHSACKHRIHWVYVHSFVEEGPMKKRFYERPAVVHTEKLEARATNCAKADDSQCGGGGPIQS
jgi:hypothetical protein